MSRRRSAALVAALTLGLLQTPVAAALGPPEPPPPSPVADKPGEPAPPRSLEEAVRQGRLDQAAVDRLQASGSVEVIATVRYADRLPAQGVGRGRYDVRGAANAYGQRKAAAVAQAGDGVRRVRDYRVLPSLALEVRNRGALLRLASAPDVVSVQANQVHEPALTQSLPLIRQPEVAAAGRTGAGTSVAVLDTGVDYTEAAFGSCATTGGDCRVAEAQDFGGDDGQLDDNGHGTNVAGAAAGVAPGAKILALDVFRDAGAHDTDINAAVDWTIANQATHNTRAMNLSIGVTGSRWLSECTDSYLTAGFRIARSLGILPVVAAGNAATVDGTYQDGVSAPACTPGAVRVGAVYDENVGTRSWMPAPYTCTDTTSRADQVTCFSQSGSLLSVLAPGAMITAAGIEQGGTSQAAPHVAGAAAVLAGVAPSASAGKVERALTQSGPVVTDPRTGSSRHRLDLVAAVAAVQRPDAVVPAAECRANTLHRNDDGSSAAVPLPFAANFFGSRYGELYVNNNGNVTFNRSMSTYTPFRIEATTPPIIAPFLADVDTRPSDSGQVTYGVTTYGGRQAFCVDWLDVGYYSYNTDKRNSFQLLLVDRSDVGAGDFDVVMNYDSITWETGDASGGSNGFGGTSAGAGYSAGTGDPAHFFQFPGSLVNGALLDNSPSGLVAGSRSSQQPGRYVFPIRNGEAPGSAAVSGTVTGPTGTLADAPVQACLDTGGCVTTRTGTSGQYSLSALPAGTYRVTAHPPAGSTLTAASATAALTVSSTTRVDLALTGPTPPPSGTTITNRGTYGDGVPVLYWRDALELTTAGCPGATGDFTITVDGQVVRSGALVETASGSGVYRGTADPLYPLTGVGEVTMRLTCPDGISTEVEFNVYIDPSGVVQDTRGNLLPGATVTLYRSDDRTGPFTQVPDGSAIMSPSNRRNPDLTDTVGHFGWDVIAGYYTVRAERPGCTSPADPAVTWVETHVMEIPPPVTDLVLTLDCGGEQDPRQAQTLTFAQPDGVTYGDPPAQLAVSASSGLPATLTTATPAVCTVSGTTVTYHAAGTCTVTASQSGDATWLAAPEETRTWAVARRPVTVVVTPPSVQYSEALPALDVVGEVQGLLPGDALAGTLTGCTATGAVVEAGEVLSPAGSYPLDGCAGLADDDYDVRYTGVLVVRPEDGFVGYTGPLLVQTSTATATSASTTLTAHVGQADDGTPGELANALVQFDVWSSGNTTTTPDRSLFATSDATGRASTTSDLGVDTWTVIARIALPGTPGAPATPTGYFAGPASDAALVTVYQPVTGIWATGGGWITDPSFQDRPVAVDPNNPKGSFGFSVRYRRGTTSPMGQAVYSFRGADGYDYVVKSTSWQGGSAAFSRTSASFSGKAVVMVLDPATGLQVGGGGNYSYRVDVVDGTTDSYALSVYTPGGVLYHQAGTENRPVQVGGGNVVVHS